MMEAAPLPSFVLRRSQGLFVDPCGTDCGERFVAFVDQVFGNDALFRDLDYANFERLLYGPWSAPGESPPILLATGIRDFSEERRQLYKALAVSEDGARAEYLFEAVFIDAEETSNEEPADGSRPGSAAPEPATLEFDEFVAHLWSGGVRFGIDAARVRKAIGSAERGRLVVANEREPRPGCDAGIEDKSRSLRRDNSPTRLGNGQHDLGSFKNRFPQVRKNEPLLRKTPRIPGEPGRKVSGEDFAPTQGAAMRQPRTANSNRPPAEIKRSCGTSPPNESTRSSSSLGEDPAARVRENREYAGADDSERGPMSASAYIWPRGSSSP